MENFTQYKLDTDAARKGDGGGYIREKGKYIGTFTQAIAFRSQKGAEGIEFEFRTQGDQIAGFSLFTTGATGDKLPGYNQLNALMACMKLRELSAPQLKSASAWDSFEGKRVKKDMPQFLDLLNKPVGLLLIMEEYAAGDGSIKNRVQFAHAFEAATELTATELLDRKVTPERLPKLVFGLQDKKANTAGASTARNASAPQKISQPPADNFDDEDIPF